MAELDRTHPVWVVDDDKSIRWVMQRALERAGLSVRLFAEASEVIEALGTEEPLVLVSDIRMPGISGTDLLEHVKAHHPEVAVIIMTAFSDLDNAVNAFQGGAFEYLAKPFDVGEAVGLVERARAEGLRKRRENGGAREAEPQAPGDPELIGRAAAMQDVFRAIGRLSQSNATVLITGESGTGKDVIARSIWQHSPRAKAPLVAINMGAIPGELLESELFGHEKGAFTGASARRIGRFEQACGGTIFLDEIGEMPMELQSALLRVLSNGSFYRVGGHQSVKADVRVIAATNRDLEESVAKGRFREDLYHRLNVIRLRLPPLRERREDIGELAAFFLKRSAREMGVAPKTLMPDALKALETRCTFPGNIRQLENLCRWLTVMAPGAHVTEKDLPPDVFETLASDFQAPGGGAEWDAILASDVKRSLEEGDSGLWAEYHALFEKTVLETALLHFNGSRQDTAERLGLGRNTITRKIKEFDIDA